MAPSDCERFPIEPAHAFVEAFADGLFRFEPKQLAGSVVHVGDAALRVGHNDAFLDRVEDRLDQSLFLRELEEIILHLLRTMRPGRKQSLVRKPDFMTSLLASGREGKLPTCSSKIGEDVPEAQYCCTCVSWK